MREAFAVKSLLHFLNKNIGKFQISTFEILTKRKLTTSLVLNNRALSGKGLFIRFTLSALRELLSFDIQSTLVISTSVISNNRLSRRKNLVLI